MPNYRRLISYIYAYEGGVKGKNTGYAKVEVRGEQCRIQVNVKKVFVGSNDIGVYLLTPGKEILIGKIFIRGGSGEFRVNVSATDVEASGYGIDQCYGLTIHDLGSTWQSYTTIWEDAVAQAAEIQLEHVTAENVRKQEAERKAGEIPRTIEEPSESQDPFPITTEIQRTLEQEEKRLQDIQPWEQEEKKPDIQPEGQEERRPDSRTERQEETKYIPEVLEGPALEGAALFGFRQDKRVVPYEQVIPPSASAVPPLSAAELSSGSAAAPESEAVPPAEAVMTSASTVAHATRSMAASGSGTVPPAKAVESITPSVAHTTGFMAASGSGTVPPAKAVESITPTSEHASGFAIATEPATVPSSEAVESSMPSIEHTSGSAVTHQAGTVPPAEAVAPAAPSVERPTGSAAVPGSATIPSVGAVPPSTSAVEQPAGSVVTSGSAAVPGSATIPPVGAVPPSTSAVEQPAGSVVTPGSATAPGSATIPPVGAVPPSTPAVEQPAGSVVTPGSAAVPGSTAAPGSTAIPPAGSASGPVRPSTSATTTATTGNASGRHRNEDMWAELEDEEVLRLLEQKEQEAKARMNPSSLWSRLQRNYSKVLAFEYDHGCEILSIKPQDIGLLPREIWVYGNNSFLLHGYYNYRHLILARLNTPNGKPRYLLGVPGHYYSNEKYMASMFGFPHFVLAKKQPDEDGRFGYWYTDIRL